MCFTSSFLRRKQSSVFKHTGNKWGFSNQVFSLKFPFYMQKLFFFSFIWISQSLLVLETFTCLNLNSSGAWELKLGTTDCLGTGWASSSRACRGCRNDSDHSECLSVSPTSRTWKDMLDKGIFLCPVITVLLGGQNQCWEPLDLPWIVFIGHLSIQIQEGLCFIWCFSLSQSS